MLLVISPLSRFKNDSFKDLRLLLEQETHIEFLGT